MLKGLFWCRRSALWGSFNAHFWELSYPSFLSPLRGNGSEIFTIRELADRNIGTIMTVGGVVIGRV